MLKNRTNNFDFTANKQQYDLASTGIFNTDKFPEIQGTVYEELIQQITLNMYHQSRYKERFANLGTQLPNNSYSGMIRDMAMIDRKGENFARDNGVSEETLGAYRIVKDKILVRYHSVQFRWTYPWTLFDEEIRRYAGNSPENAANAIAQITTMQTQNMVKSKNLNNDNIRLKVLNIASKAIGKEYLMGEIDITDFETLTTEEAKQWLVNLDKLFYTLTETGTTEFTDYDILHQLDAEEIDFVINYDSWKNVLRRAYPDTYHKALFEDVVPKGVNMIFTTGLGDVKITEADGTEIIPTFSTYGMNELTWGSDWKEVKSDPSLQGYIFHKKALGFELNLDTTLTGQKDIEKLATPVRSHYWNSAYFTDLLPFVNLKRGE